MSTCGTGGWSGPLPGDPDNNVTLTAAKIYGGIQVAWSFPATNPHAVAHVLLYRGTNPIFEQALQLAIVSANFYFDPNNSTASYSYYYWIKVVSINGTVGAAIGPASASSTPSIGDVIAQLSGQINDTALAASLRTKLGDITLNSAGIANLVSKRLLDNSTWEAALLALSGQISGAETLIEEYALQRKQDNDAFALKVNAQAAVNAAGISSAISDYNLALVSPTSAISIRIADTVTATANARSAVQTLQQASVGYAAMVAAPYTPSTGDGSTIIYSVSEFPNFLLDRTIIIDAIGVAKWNAIHGSTMPLVWVSGYPLAQIVNRVGISDGTTVGGVPQYMTLENRMIAQKTINGKLLGQWYVKVGTGNKVSGIGLSSETAPGGETTSNFIVDVDTFSVAGRNSTINPFIVDATTGNTYIDNALIRQLTANNIDTSAIQIQSSNYGSGTGISVTGARIVGKKNNVETFSIGSDGTATFSGTLSAGIVSTGSIVNGAVTAAASGGVYIPVTTGTSGTTTTTTYTNTSDFPATVLIIAAGRTGLNSGNALELLRSVTLYQDNGSIYSSGTSPFIGDFITFSVLVTVAANTTSSFHMTCDTSAICTWSLSMGLNFFGAMR